MMKSYTPGFVANFTSFSGIQLHHHSSCRLLEMKLALHQEAWHRVMVFKKHTLNSVHNKPRGRAAVAAAEPLRPRSGRPFPLPHSAGPVGEIQQLQL